MDKATTYKFPNLQSKAKLGRCVEMDNTSHKQSILIQARGEWTVLKDTNVPITAPFFFIWLTSPSLIKPVKISRAERREGLLSSESCKAIVFWFPAKISSRLYHVFEKQQQLLKDNLYSVSQASIVTDACDFKACRVNPQVNNVDKDYE